MACDDARRGCLHLADGLVVPSSDDPALRPLALHVARTLGIGSVSAAALAAPPPGPFQHPLPASGGSHEPPAPKSSGPVPGAVDVFASFRKTGAAK